jgi:hypothetical protein
MSRASLAPGLRQLTPATISAAQQGQYSEGGAACQGATPIY